jgi:hypothetical protein
MNIKKFAVDHRLKVTEDECGDPVIIGRMDESNIYEYSDTELGVMFATDGKKAPRSQIYNTFKAACLKAGMTLRQSGDAEGAFSFNPANPEQAKAAIKGVRARFKRKMTPESLARLAIARQSIKRPLQEALVST